MVSVTLQSLWFWGWLGCRADLNVVVRKTAYDLKVKCLGSTLINKYGCFIVTPSMAPFSHRKPSYAATFRETRGDQDSDKRDGL